MLYSDDIKPQGNTLSNIARAENDSIRMMLVFRWILVVSYMSRSMCVTKQKSQARAYRRREQNCCFTENDDISTVKMLDR